MPKQQIEIDNTKTHLEEKLASYFGVTPSDASIDQMYKAVSMSVLDILLEKKKQFNRKVKEQKSKRVYYLCMEFLVGRSLKTNLYNLGIVDSYREVLKEYGFDLDELYDLEVRTKFQISSEYIKLHGITWSTDISLSSSSFPV